MKRKQLKCGFLAVLASLVGSCSSSDLGKEEQPSIAVNTANPTFESDIAAIVKAKCSTCHTTNKGKFVPSTTPVNSALDNMHDKTSFDSKASSIKTYVFDTPSNPMPPLFATQLTDNEKAAMRVYLDAVIASKATLTCSATTANLTYADVSAILSTSCVTCHASQSPKLSTLDEVKSARTRAYNSINDKTMPVGNAAFHDMPERTKLLDWLCAGSEFK